jgi:hypothetical protein
MNSASVLGINFYIRQVERQQVELYSTAPCTVFNMILEVIKKAPRKRKETLVKDKKKLPKLISKSCFTLDR